MSAVGFDPYFSSSYKRWYVESSPRCLSVVVLAPLSLPIPLLSPRAASTMPPRKDLCRSAAEQPWPLRGYGHQPRRPGKLWIPGSANSGEGAAARPQWPLRWLHWARPWTRAAEPCPRGWAAPAEAEAMWSRPAWGACTSKRSALWEPPSRRPAWRGRQRWATARVWKMPCGVYRPAMRKRWLPARTPKAGFWRPARRPPTALWLRLSWRRRLICC